MISDLIPPGILGLDFLQHIALWGDLLKILLKCTQQPVEQQQFIQLINDAQRNKHHVGVNAAAGTDSSVPGPSLKPGPDWTGPDQRSILRERY